MKLKHALEHYQSGRLAEAIETCEKVLQSEPNNAEVLHLMGKMACQLGNTDLAITLIAKACVIFPRNTAYLLSMGMALRMSKQFDEAINCYHVALQLEPSSASAYFGLGNTFYSQNQLDEAAQYFRQALKLKPDMIEAHYNLANIEKSCGNYAEAIQHYQTAIALRPSFADAHHNLGSALHASGQLDEALQSYEQALQQNLPETHNNIGNIFFEKKELELAIAYYRQAIKIKPDYVEALNNLGQTLQQLGRIQESASVLTEAIRICPESAITHLNFGNMLMANGSDKEALIHFEHAIRKAPELAEAYFNQGVIKSRENDWLAACHSFEQARLHRPGYLDAIYNLGIANGHIGRGSEAELCYKSVLEIDPTYVNAHINLSGILMENGQSSEAKKHMDIAYSQKNIFEKSSPTANKTILILFDAGKGNVNLTYLFNEKNNNLIDWMIGYAPDGQALELPDYDLVFNAMGDADITGDTMEPVRKFLEICNKPLLNHPEQVAQTARDKLPNLLSGIDHLLIARVWRFATAANWDDTVSEELPLLLRPVQTHGGAGLQIAATKEELASLKKNQHGPIYVCPFIDFRSADGWYRKYRMIFIDRKPYPYHLAISKNWIVHYYTADMESVDWKLDEERQFLMNPEAILGKNGMAAIEYIARRIDLDYAGIDFSLMADGRILVFEANPVMLAHPEKSDGPLTHKNEYIQKIFDAFETLLCKRVESSKTDQSFT